MALVQILTVDRKQMFEPYSRLWGMMLPEIPKSADMVQAEYAHAPDGAFDANWLVQEGENVIGLGSLWDEKGDEAVGLLYFEALFAPNVNVGAISELFETALNAAREVSATEITGWTCTRSLQVDDFYLKTGWRHIQIVPFSRKRLENAVPVELNSKVGQVMNSGIQIKSIADLVREGIDWKRGLYDVTWEIAQDIPNPDAPARLPFDQYSRMLDNRTLYDYELMFVALDEGKMIGYSRVSPLGEGSKTVQTGMSGVIRPYRRRGVVTALKVQGFDRLRERGYEWICTDNDETNAMYELNQRFGFEKFAEFRAYKLVL